MQERLIDRLQERTYRRNVHIFRVERTQGFRVYKEAPLSNPISSVQRSPAFESHFEFYESSELYRMYERSYSTKTSANKLSQAPEAL